MNHFANGTQRRRGIGFLLGVLLLTGLLAPHAASQGVVYSQPGSTGGGWSSGHGQDSEGWKNIFGWRVGHVKLIQGFTCLGCTCLFVGAPILTETLPIQECAVSATTTLPVRCPPSSGCPDGAIGQQTTVAYECCLTGTLSVSGPGGTGASVGGALCVGSTLTITSCP